MFLAPAATISSDVTRPVAPGSAVTINCSSTGDGVSQTVLRRDGTEVLSGVVSVTYTIASFSDGDIGTYDCLAENPIGGALSEGLYLDTGEGCVCRCRAMFSH